MKTIRVVAAVICNFIEHKTKIFPLQEATGNSKAAGNFPAVRSKPERLHSRKLSERSGRNWISSREKTNTEKMKLYDLR